jgi:hypothetical protein
MSERETKIAGPAIVGAIVLALFPLVAYIGAYFALCGFQGDWRVFRYKWQVTVFTPAAKVEGLVTARTLHVGTEPASQINTWDRSTP